MSTEREHPPTSIVMLRIPASCDVQVSRCPIPAVIGGANRQDLTLTPAKQVAVGLGLPNSSDESEREGCSLLPPHAAVNPLARDCGETRSKRLAQLLRPT